MFGHDGSFIRAAVTYAFCALFFGIFSFSAIGQNGRLLLNCKIEEGSPSLKSTQIMIDEAENIVVYNYQWIGSTPKRKFQNDGKALHTDYSMQITMNNDKIIMANDTNGAFVMTKHDGHFVKAWVMPIPPELTKHGNWVAFGNVHIGSCVRSPFE